MSAINDYRAECARKYLDKLRVLDSKINFKREELAEVKSTLGHSARGHLERVQTSISVDGICQEVIRYLYMETDLSDCIAEFLTEKEKIVSGIFSLENSKYIDVLTQRYVKFKDFEDIAEYTGYSLRHLMRLHKKALIAFYNEVMIKKEAEQD